MKHLIFILFLGISCFGYSTKGFDYYRYSLLYGKIYKNDLFYYSLEFNLHKRFVGRHYRGNYHGIGASIDYGKDYQSFGLKGMLNPTYIEFELTRRIRFHPYIWIQGNLVRKDEKLISKEHNIASGLGLYGHIHVSRCVFLRPQIQVGYGLNKEYLSGENGLVIEAKIGVGITKFIYPKKD